MTQCHPLALSARELNFQKGGWGGGGLTGPQLLEGVGRKEGATSFRGSSNFYVKEKLKSEIFNGKKSL